VKNVDVDEEKCGLCGTLASPGAEYCVTCGESLKRKTSPIEQQPQGPPTYNPSLRVEPPTAFATALPYQGVAIRFVAQLVDVIILGVVFWLLGFTGAGTITIDAATAQVTISPLFGLLMLIDVIIAFLYFTVLEGWNGQTVGKMVVKIKVVRKEDHSSISYAEAATRTILRIIDLIPFIAPYLLAAVLIWSSEGKQRLGDRVAHTVVVST
jgi:uncharacterized RDD family membrane protein YckC